MRKMSLLLSLLLMCIGSEAESQEIHRRPIGRVVLVKIKPGKS